MLLGPQSSYPSRFFQDHSSSEFYDVVHPKDRVPRDVSEHQKKITEIEKNKDKRGQKTQSKKDAQQLGMLPVSSVLWRLEVFSQNFFWAHTNCYLHLEKEGNLARWLTYFGIKCGKKICEKINSELEAVTSNMPGVLLKLSRVCLPYS